jgi:type II secretory pathway component PulK
MSIHRRRHSRGGALLVCVLVCLLVACSLVTAMTSNALRFRRDVRLQHQMRQTELLLDAGVLRAARLLRASSDYQGESWRPDHAIERFGNPQIEIRVETIDSDSRRVAVTAGLGIADDDGQQQIASRTRRTHIFDVELSDSTQISDSPSAE